MKPLVFLLLLACVCSSGCTLSGGRESLTATTAREPTPAPREPEVDRFVPVYAAVIRHLVTEDNTFGRADPGFEVVYVLDGSVSGAERVATWINKRPPGEPFTDGVKTRLQEKLADLPDVVFVRDRSSVLDDAGAVQNHGVLLTLGPIEGARRVKVGSNLWVAGKGALWLTYVLKQQAGRWVVTGTTGPVSMS